MTGRRGLATDLAVLAGLKAALGAFVLGLGFRHISDDDYARVVIAEAFARLPRLDPSGTSWLPLPFWLNGAAMMLGGRSLATARAVAIVLGVVSVAPPYLAARAVSVGRPYALAAGVIAMFAPWNAWLGVATVPEALTGSLIAAGVIASSAPRGRVWSALALLVASLSRYEAWPVAAGFAVICAYDHAVGARGAGGRGSRLTAAAVAAAGPLAWMAWNAHAHGSALHFFDRVATFRQATGAANAPFAEKLTTYPLALLDAAPWPTALASLGLFGLRDAATRARWGRPLALAALMMAFLVYGDVRDGAPTHHPERALVAFIGILATFGVDGTRALARGLAWARPRREMWVVGAVTAAVIAWLAALPSSLRAFPGQSEAEARTTQVERGQALRREGARVLDVVPCAYEHFALLAAFGAPEAARIAPATHAPMSAACPAVDVLR